MYEIQAQKNFENYKLDRAIFDILKSIRSASTIVLNNSRMIEESEQMRINMVLETREAELSDIANGSKVLVGDSGVGKTSLVLSSIYRNFKFENDDAVDTYFINFGGEVWGFPFGLPKLLPSGKSTMAEKIRGSIDERMFYKLLEYGLCYATWSRENSKNIEFDLYDGDFVESMLKSPEGGTYIFDDVQWLNLLPKETIDFAVNEIFLPLSEAKGTKVYFTSIKGSNIARCKEFAHPPESLIKNFEVYEVSSYKKRRNRDIFE